MQGIMAKKPYDCAKCPGYCCSYHIIPVKESDLKRLAKHFKVSLEEAKKKFVKADEHYGKICRFFDQEKRCCGVYEARPYICRAYPTGKCGYYEFLKIERDTQDDQEMVAGTWND